MFSVPEAVLFDLDGTLLNSVDVYFRILVQTWQKAGLPVPDHEVVRGIMLSGQPFWESWALLVPKEAKDDLELKLRVQKLEREIWEEVFYRETQLVAGAGEVIHLFHHLGFQLGIVTSDWGEEKYIPFRQAGTEVRKYFSAIITRTEVKRLKPAPDPIAECLKKLGVSPENAVYVGDAPVDMQAGKAAGVKTIGVLTGIGTREILEREHPDIIIESVAGLVDLAYFWLKSARRLYLSEGFYKSFRGLTQKFYSFAERYKMNPTQLAAIQKLRSKDGLSISELAEEMTLRVNSCSELVNRMEKQGLVRKEKNDGDNRIVSIYLTEKSRQMISNLASFSKETEEFLEQYLSPKELLWLSQILQKLVRIFADE